MILENLRNLYVNLKNWPWGVQLDYKLDENNAKGLIHELQFLLDEKEVFDGNSRRREDQD